MKTFSIGEVYFKVYFIDCELLYPFVGAYVFLGQNLQGKEVGDTWYFQDCESYVHFGSFMNDDTDGPREILGLDATAIEDVADADGLMNEVSRAAERRKAARKPR